MFELGCFGVACFLVFAYWATRQTAQPSPHSSARHGDRDKDASRGVGPRITVSAWGDLQSRSRHRRQLSDGEKLEQSRSCWVSAGQTVSVGRFQVPRGLLYVGHELDGVSDYGGADACLIDDRLEVSSSASSGGQVEFGYWPRYAELTPPHRATYLQWLAAGRRDPDINIGSVFLFFYGLERRVIFDAAHDQKAAAEIPGIRRELTELLELHGDQRSFRAYAVRLLDFLDVRADPAEATTGNSPARSDLDPIDAVREAGALTEAVKIELGRLVQQGEPLPATWAFAYLCGHPIRNFRTAARRCPDEFRDLFLLRYPERFGRGLVIRPNKTKLQSGYHPASPSLSFSEHVFDPPLPDVAVLTAPARKLMELSQAVQDELDAYSRWVGRTDDCTSLAAIAHLPSALVRGRLERHRARLRTFEEAVAHTTPALLSTGELRSIFDKPTSENLTKAEAKQAAELLEAIGIGIEPDPRTGGPNPAASDQFAIFQLNGSPAERAADLEEMRLVLRLAVLVALADGEFSESEQRLIDAIISKNTSHEADRARLRAHALWLSTEASSLRGARAKLEALGSEARHTIAAHLLAVATADGHLAPEELKLLEKVYALLGLPPSQLHTMIHRHAVHPASTPRGSLGGSDPAKILDGSAAVEFDIPDQPSEPPGGAATSADLQLDRTAIDEIRRSSERAAAHLAPIFDDEAEATSANAADLRAGSHVSGSATETQGVWSGMRLGDRGTLFFTELVEKPEWSGEDLRTLAAHHDVMLGGLIEAINERAIELCGDPLIDPGDPAYVEEAVLTELRLELSQE